MSAEEKPAKPAKKKGDWRGRVRRFGGSLARYAAGVLFCQRAVLSVAVVGWTYRLMQRNAVRYWYRHGACDSACDSFEQFARSGSATESLSRPPRFVLAAPDESPRPESGKIRRTVRRMTGSLVENLKVGLLGFANTCVLVLPAEILWFFGWFAGWHISFNKVYEEHTVGIAVSWLGIAWFIAAMFYVPMAQARQAVTGDWRSFYDFRLIRSLIARHRFACLLMAAVYAAASLPLTLFKFAPYFLGGNTAAVETMPDAALIALLNRFFLITTFIAFPLYVGIRLLAARIYARAVVHAVRDGVIRADALSNFEHATLTRLGLAEPAAPPLPEPVVRRVPRKAWRAAIVTATIAVWFIFVAQIYVGEFFVYRGARGWLNQSLVQLPWYRYVPSHLDGGNVAEAAPIE